MRAGPIETLHTKTQALLQRTIRSSELLIPQTTTGAKGKDSNVGNAERRRLLEAPNIETVGLALRRMHLPWN